MIITSTDNRLVRYAYSLKLKKYRDTDDRFLIEGEHLIEMCDDIDYILTTNKDYHKDGVEVFQVTENVIRKLSFVQSNQGIIAVCNKKKYQIDYTKKRFLLCDGVSDPGNLGTIIRSALAFNVDQIILSKGSVDVYNDKVIRATQGAFFKISLIVTDLEDVITNLKNHDVKVYASTLASDSINLKDVKEVDKFALIVGNEGQGISKESFENSDYRIKIKHSSLIDSLNVGVATSIMLYYFDLISK